MPFPLWTLAECEAAIQAIDAILADMRGLATRFTVGDKTFDHTSTRGDLLDERAAWVARRSALLGETTSTLQGPRFVRR